MWPHTHTGRHTDTHIQMIYFNQGAILRIRPVTQGNNIDSWNHYGKGNKVDAKEYIDMQFDSLTIWLEHTRMPSDRSSSCLCPELVLASRPGAGYFRRTNNDDTNRLPSEQYDGVGGALNKLVQDENRKHAVFPSQSHGDAGAWDGRHAHSR